ncbi:MAG TPA: hypothetical protein VKY32_03835 [Flavobacterium sp.]|nr:hypothetical protein [Flavobacterium sp.]
MKKLVLIAVMAAGTLAFQSCSSDDGGGAVPNPADTMVPTLLNYGADGKEYFVYNNNKYLTKYTDIDGYTYDFTYSGDRVTKVVETFVGSDDEVTYTVSYPSSTSVKIVVKDSSDNSQRTDNLNIDANGNLSNVGGDVASFYEYENGNLVSITIQNEGSLDIAYNSDLAINKNVKTAGWVYTYFHIFPLSKSQNLISSIADEDGETTNYNYSNYAVEGNLFPETINLSGDEQGTITITYQE